MIRDPATQGGGSVKVLELRRHARRDPSADRLSTEGRAQAEDLGRASTGAFDAVFTSPAQRAAETAAWILRGMHAQLPAAHAVVPALGGRDTDGSPTQLARAVSELLDAVPENGRGLAISHTPIVEKATEGLTGRRIEPLAECEGVRLVRADDGSISAEELRLGR
jgi:phosphohistidine phosphatase SixA